MTHKIELLVKKQFRHQLDNQTTATIRFDDSTVWFPIASVRRLTIRGSKLAFEQPYSYIAHRDGTRTELVVRGNVY